MLKSGIDQDALIEMFASASAQQTAQLREAVSQATLKALQGRERSLKNIKQVIKAVTEATSAGALQNVTPKVDVEAMLNGALAGMDDALLKAVEANRVALERLVDQGVDLQEKQLKKALGDLEKLEDTMFDTIRKASGGADLSRLAGPWGEVLGKFEQAGSLTGAQATATLENLTGQMQTAVRETRAAGLKAAQTLAQSYAALVSGVLMGMSDALRQGGGETSASGGAPARPAGKSSRKSAG